MAGIPFMDFSPLDGDPETGKLLGVTTEMPPIATLGGQGNTRKLSKSSFHQKSVEEVVDTVKMNKFMEAAIAGEVRTLQEILDTDAAAAAHYKDLAGNTALHFACRYVNKDVVRLLLKFHADPNAEDGQNWRPLHFASKYFQRDLSTDITESYSEKDVEKSKNDTRDIIDQLIVSKADVNAVESFGCSALHYAALRGNSAAAERLLHYGAEPNLEDDNHITPFMTSCTYGTIEVFDILFPDADMTHVDRRGNTVLHIAAQHGHIEIIRRLLSWIFTGKGDETRLSLLHKGNKEGKTALQLAADADHADVVEELMERYEEESQSTDENLMLHKAAAKGHKDICVILIEKAGMEVIKEDDNGQIPLHLAAKNNHDEIVEYLLSIRGDTIESKDNDGFTPLLLAASSNGLETVKVLLERKARFTISDRLGRNIIHLTAKYNAIRVLQYMLDHMEDKKGQAIVGFKQGLRRRPSSPRDDFAQGGSIKDRMINKTDMNQETAMHCVCGNGYLELVQLLYAHGASISCMNEDEENPLHLAAEGGRTNVVNQLLEWENKLCLGKSDEGKTPLHKAAANGYDETVIALIGGGSDLRAKNVFDETALDCAIKAGELATTKALMERGANPSDDEDKGMGTPLHLAVTKGWDEIVFYLIDKKMDVGRRDENGNTALDLAIAGGHREIARMLVCHPDWKKLMAPTDEYPLPQKSKTPRDTPMRRLIETFPDVAWMVFENCCTKGEKMGGDFQGKTSTEHNWEYLEDNWMMINRADDKCTLSSKCPYDSITGKLLPEATSYSNNNDMIYDNHPLRLMVKSNREALLSHKLVKSLLKHKWNSLCRYIYYTGLAVYCIFISFFTVFISTAHAPYNLESNGTWVNYSTIVGDETECRLYRETHSRPFLQSLCKFIVVSLSTVQLFKEGHQFVTRRLSYFSWENAIELFIYISGQLVVHDFNECSRITGIREPWQWELAAVSAFFQWLNLLLLVRKLPRFGIYVLMLFDIFKTFSRFSLIFALFIIAFSISFFILLQNRPEFSNILSSIMKTTVMMIGEFEYTGIFHGDASDPRQVLNTTSMAYPLFLIFAVVMTILLMNLLVGLAVDDIKGVQELAKLKRLSMQVDLVLQIECHIFHYIRRRVARGSRKSFSEKTLWEKFLSHFGSSDASKEEDEEEEESDEEEKQLEKALNVQKLSLAEIQSNVDVIYSKQLKMEDTLAKILQILDRNQGNGN